MKCGLSLPNLLMVALLSALTVGCTGPEVVQPEDIASIEGALEQYLPRMATAYQTGDLSVLEGFAAEKEIAGLERRLRDLLAESREIHPVLKSFRVEDVQIWNYANAFATTLEVWDLTVLAAGTDVVLSQAQDQRNRVKYQLKRMDGSWLILFRELETTFE